MPFLIIHGHFYQPPRENPWTGIVEAQSSAAPFHDWNERIHAECYAANAAAIIDGLPVNNYAHISFNFGPTLLSWLELNHHDTYSRVIEADRQSAVQHAGHGNAIAQAYGHAILSLCNDRDLRTQIRWGLADFRQRFGREAEAMWLPETACSDRVMAALIDEGLRFVILAPNQAARVRNPSAGDKSEHSAQEWRGVNQNDLDTSVPYQYFHRDGSRRSIAVFFYNGVVSRAIAFDGLLKSSHELIEAFARSADGKSMVHVATDGETYGHHFKFGDLCLAHALTREAPARGFEVANYGQYLEQHPPTLEVEISNGPEDLGTSWSCAHGVGRWIRDCGCRTGGDPNWTQSWRTPLRQALDFLRDENAVYFEATRGKLFIFPWLARDDSIALILNSNEPREQFLYEHAARGLSRDEQWRALSYLELQRMLLLMYTSCGWFFNDISGIETIQILKYAARAIDLMQQLKLPSVRDKFLEILGEAKSNRAELGTGADIYRRLVEPSRANMKAPPEQDRGMV